MRRASAIFGVMTTAALLTTACSSSGSAKPGGATQPPANSAAATTSATQAAPAPRGAAQSWPAEPPMTINPARQYTMTLHTSQGDIVIKLDAAKAPHTVNSFDFLAAHKYFDGTYCHRLSTSQGLQMLQCGDPNVGATPKDSDGTGGPGYTFPDENLAGATYPAGTVAMANAGANTNGSQFFLVFGDSQLQPAYTPFGTITSGLDVLTKVAAAGIDNPGSDGTGRPKLPVQLETVTLTAG